MVRSNVLLAHACGSVDAFTQMEPYVHYSQYLEKQFFKDLRIKNAFDCPSDLDIILCHNYKETPLTERSLNYLGIKNHIVLGQSIRDWVNVQKIDLVRNYLVGECQKPFVLCLDASDVLVLGDPAEILRRFLESFSCRVLFNAEKNSYPASWLGNPIFQVKTEVESQRIASIETFERKNYKAPFVHLNSGCYIGYREDVIRMLEEAWELKGMFCPSYAYSDQVLLREIHRRHYPKIQIDDECQIFQAFYQIEWQEIKTSYRLPWVADRFIKFKNKFFRLGRR